MADRVYYTPAKLRALIDGFSELGALAENRTTARGLLRAGATIDEPNVQRRGLVGDQRTWSCVTADVDRAYRSLEDRTVEHDVILHRLFGMSLDGIAAGMHVRRQRVAQAYENALIRMAHFLEGDAITEPVREYDRLNGITGAVCMDTGTGKADMRK